MSRRIALFSGGPSRAIRSHSSGILSVLSRALHVTSPVFDIPICGGNVSQSLESSNLTIKFFDTDVEPKLRLPV